MFFSKDERERNFSEVSISGRKFFPEKQVLFDFKSMLIQVDKSLNSGWVFVNVWSRWMFLRTNVFFHLGKIMKTLESRNIFLETFIMYLSNRHTKINFKSIKVEQMYATKWWDIKIFLMTYILLKYNLWRYDSENKKW